MMRNKGVAAFVTDGLARDKAGILATGLPVFCAGIQPNSPAMHGPGVVGAPVTLCDVPVCPGDIVVGDADGVVIVPAGRARQVLDRLARVRSAEARTIALVEQGATMAAGAQRLIDQAVIVTD
jgi:regulator of RNase E activity RraA